MPSYDCQFESPQLRLTKRMALTSIRLLLNLLLTVGEQEELESTEVISKGFLDIENTSSNPNSGTLWCLQLQPAILSSPLIGVNHEELQII
jgi:hypothetical protein